MAANGMKPKGGKREGAGRNPDWLKAKCRGIIAKKKLIEFLGTVAAGEPVAHKVAIVSTGKVLEKTLESAEVKDRLRAMEMLLDRGWGKPVQTIDPGNEWEDLMARLHERYK